MASLTPLTIHLCRDCGARASVTLIGLEGQCLADFCRRHGGRALRDRLKAEATIPKVIDLPGRQVGERYGGGFMGFFKFLRRITGRTGDGETPS